MQAKDRLIVALDVATRQEAERLVESLKGTVSVFKVGSEMLGVWGPDFVDRLTTDREVFIDLKLGDIDETARRTVAVWAGKRGVKFLTIGSHTARKGIQAALDGRGGRSEPRLLYVSYLSSLDAADFGYMHGRQEADFDDHVLMACQRALEAGCDGLIASGRHIRMLREKFPNTIIVSPGIRPLGSSVNDHLRTATPTEAIKMGANYLVVGRPIRNSPDPKAAAEKIIEEIDQASRQGHGRSSHQGTANEPRQSMCAKPLE